MFGSEAATEITLRLAGLKPALLFLHAVHGIRFDRVVRADNTAYIVRHVVALRHQRVRTPPRLRSNVLVTESSVSAESAEKVFCDDFQPSRSALVYSVVRGRRNDLSRFGRHSSW